MKIPPIFQKFWDKDFSNLEFKAQHVSKPNK